MCVSVFNISFAKHTYLVPDTFNVPQIDATYYLLSTGFKMSNNRMYLELEFYLSDLKLIYFFTMLSPNNLHHQTQSKIKQS